MNSEALEEIAAGLEALAVSVRKLIGEGTPAAGPEKKETKEAAPEKKEDKPKADEKPKYTKADVRKALADQANAGRGDEVREILKKHGAARLSEIPESEYDAIMAEVKEMEGGS